MQTASAVRSSPSPGTAPQWRNAGHAYRPVGASGEPYPTWVRELKSKVGVYLIRDAASHEILYVGSSSSRLYDTLTRHFQQWRRYKGYWRGQYWRRYKGYWRGQYAEGHDPGLTYHRARVEVAVKVTSPADALDEETRMIRRLNPRDNILGQPELEDAPF